MPCMGGTGTDQKTDSSVSILRSDKVVMVAIDLPWKDEYSNKLANPIRDYFDGVAGQGMLLAVQHPWRKLSDAVKRFHQTGKFPKAALSRPSTAARMGLPFAPEQRVSWLVELLPGLGYSTLYSQIDKTQGWNTPANLRAGRAWIPGGGATVQGVAPKDSFLPYRVMQANKDFGAYAIMCDGSIRFIKPSVS